MSMNDNKQLVITAMTELIENANLDAVGPSLAVDFIDHNPQVSTTSRADWIAAFRDFPLQDMRIDIERAIAQDDYVTMFSRRWLPNGDVIAVADVFRFADDDLIAEHWEVVQPIDAADNPLALLGSGSGSGSAR